MSQPRTVVMAALGIAGLFAALAVGHPSPSRAAAAATAPGVTGDAPAAAAPDTSSDAPPAPSDAGAAFLRGLREMARLPADAGWQAELLTPTLVRLWRRGGEAVEGRVRSRQIEVTVGEESVPVARIGHHVYPIDKEVPPWPPRIVLGREVLVELGAPVPTGARATVRARIGDGRVVREISFDPDRPSPFVKVNQVGFLTDDPRKTAYVAGFLGTLGALPVSPTRFEILDAASGEVVWSGRSAETATPNRSYGETVLALPFGSFDRAGRYVIRVPGVGRSGAFRVGRAVYEPAFRAVQRAFYHHRCGSALEAKYTTYERATCHPAEREGCVHEKFPETALHADEEPGACVGTTGGWHDASDYGKYIPTAGAAVYDMLRVASVAPDLLADGAAGIPESGNGVPDLLDEIAWELDWVLRMQRPDGGVYHKVNGRRWADGKTPAEDEQTRWLAEVTTHDTGRAAAMLALGARHLKPHDPERAARYEAAARKAWAFLSAHPEPMPEGGFKNRDWVGGGEYGDRFEDADERAWAAVELYALTGDKAFHDAFLARLPEKRNPKVPPFLVRDWPPRFEDSWRFALWSYATLPEDRPVEMAIVKDIGDAWRFRAEELAAEARKDPYGLSFVAPAKPASFGYGHANGVAYARDLLLACHLLGPRGDWVRAALGNLDAFLGANGRGIAYLTGVGERTVRDIEFRMNHLDDIDDPLPGHPVDGPASFVHASDRAFEPHLVPAGDDYPPMQRYFDFPDAVLNEPTIDEMASVAIPLALLASPKNRALFLATLAARPSTAPKGDEDGGS